MTDEEFDILDELYFVIPFSDLQTQTGLNDSKLLEVLRNMHKQGWVRVMKTIDEDWQENITDDQMKQSYYLATKKGLMAHNS